MPTVIYAIGHSTRTIDDFIEILEAHAVSMLVDIRTIPKSRHNPQFNEDTLKTQPGRRSALPMCISRNWAA